MSEMLAARQEKLVSAVPPPPGVQQDFVNPPIAAQDAYILVAVGVSVAGVLLLMRLYTKGVILKKFGWEDVAILLAFAFSTADCVLILEGREYGTGRHIWDVPVTTLVPKWGQVVTAAVVVYCPAIMFSKVAVLLCYLRISTKSLFRTSVYITIAIVFAYNIALMLSLIFACHPIAKTWDLTITTGSCINRPAVYVANGVLNIVTDFTILLLPLPLIRGLHVPNRQKLLLAAMFSVGSLTCVVSVIRLKTLIPTLKVVDQTWAIAGPGNWIIVEINLAVACGCLAAIRPFLRRHFPLLIGESRNSHADRYSKVSRKEYFARSKPRTADNISESNARLSHGNHNLPSWEALGYSQEVKAIHGGDPYAIDDLELSPVEPEARLKRHEALDDQFIHAVTSTDETEEPQGIMKTTEINVQR